MRYCRVRLTEFASHLEFGQMREEDCYRIWTREGPLQEVNLSALAFSRKWEDELRMSFGGGLDVGICGVRDDSTQGPGIIYVTKTPDVLDFFGWKLQGLRHIDEGGERLDTKWRR